MSHKKRITTYKPVKHAESDHAPRIILFGSGINYMMTSDSSTPLRVTVMVSGVEPC